MGQSAVIVGCDVSKLWVDVCVADDCGRKATRVRNDPEILKSWAQSLPKVCLAGMESTGSYHLSLARALIDAGHTVYVINPRWVHAYAQSTGQRGKTDRSDAALIARYVQSEAPHLHAFEYPSEEQVRLRYLLLRRQELVKLRSATRQSFGEEAVDVVAQFNRLLRRVEREIHQLIQTHMVWREHARRLRQIPGVGPMVAAHLVQVLTRIPFAGADAFIAHTGTDPRANDSGQKRGRRRLSHHGDSSLRHMLFMAAMAAIKQSEWRNLYERYRNRGLPSTGALIACARKLARIAWRMFKHPESYDPSKVAGPLVA
jgi:transposase